MSRHFGIKVQLNCDTRELKDCGILKMRHIYEEGVENSDFVVSADRGDPMNEKECGKVYPGLVGYFISRPIF